MKASELLKKWPAKFLVWNLNEDTEVFWTDTQTLEENGFLDPWGQRISLQSARRVKDRWGDLREYRIESEFQGYPIELVIINE